MKKCCDYFLAKWLPKAQPTTVNRANYATDMTDVTAFNSPNND